MKLSGILLITMLLGILNGYADKGNKKLTREGYKLDTVSEKDLLKWKAFGQGIKAINHGQLIISEKQGSKGYMLVSPASYNKDVVMSFDVMSLNPATVLIVEMFASNKNGGQLEFPEGYDGNLKFLFNELDMYMIAFHNAAHNKPGPFIRKFPEPGMEPLAMAKKHALNTGVFHRVELERKGNIIWLKVDGKKKVVATDSGQLLAGKMILRIRGTAQEHASCIIRNMQIYSN